MRKVKTEFIPLDYGSFEFKGKNYAMVFGRNSKGERLCVVDSCPAYFWAILKPNLSEKKVKEVAEKVEKLGSSGKEKAEVKKVEICNKKFLEKDVLALKVFVSGYKNLRKVVEKLNFPEIDKKRGYDVGFITHYIIEKGLLPLHWYEIEGEILDNSKELGGIGPALDVDKCIHLSSHKELKGKSEKGFSPKVLAFDIETDDLKIGKGEILMVSLVSDNLKKVLTWKKVPKAGKYVEFVKDEAELLKKFAKEVRKISPDFLVGYFSDGFDLPYLRARAEKLGVKLSLGLDGSQPKFQKGAILSAKILGISHIDLLRFIQTIYGQYMQSETFSLNEVAKEFLGDSKKDFTHMHSSKINNWNSYFEYNLQDSLLTYKLFEKFWKDLAEFSNIIHEPPFEISRSGLSKLVELYILHQLPKYNEIPEAKPSYDEIRRRRERPPVKGAFVLEPKPGIYENIVMFDFSSMHTSIIISMNLSKATLLEKKEKDCYETPEFYFGNKKTRFYFSKKQGFFASIMKEVLEKRKQYKKEYKKNPNVITKARSNAFKVLSASVHGYIGFFGARYYSLETSASILAFVRKYNKGIIEKVKRMGYEVIYGDTDSIAFVRGKKSKKDVLDLLKKLNNELPGVMELELEDFYKRGIWVTTRTGKAGAKKKYALINEKGRLKIRGFETVRRDWCELARKVQDKVLRLILEDGNEKRALKYVKEIIEKIKQKRIPLNQLIIKTQLKKPLSEYKAISPHVIAAKKMKDSGIPVEVGGLIEYYIAKSQKEKSLIRERVKLPQEKGEYDIEYYLEHQIIPAVENIFQVFGIDAKNLVKRGGGGHQKTLHEF